MATTNDMNSSGPTIAILLVLVVLVIGGFYFMNTRNEDVGVPKDDNTIELNVGPAKAPNTPATGD